MSPKSHPSLNTNPCQLLLKPSTRFTFSFLLLATVSPAFCVTGILAVAAPSNSPNPIPLLNHPPENSASFPTNPDHKRPDPNRAIMLTTPTTLPDPTPRLNVRRAAAITHRRSILSRFSQPQQHHITSDPSHQRPTTSAKPAPVIPTTSPTPNPTSTSGPSHVSSAPMSWRTCGGGPPGAPQLTPDSVTLSPDPPHHGRTLSINVSGLSPISTSDGRLRVAVLYMGFKVYTYESALCESMTCPLVAGTAFHLQVSQKLPALAPPGSYSMEITGQDAAGTRFMCVSISFSVTLPSGRRDVDLRCEAAATASTDH